VKPKKVRGKPSHEKKGEGEAHRRVVLREARRLTPKRIGKRAAKKGAIPGGDHDGRNDADLTVRKMKSENRTEETRRKGSVKLDPRTLRGNGGMNRYETWKNSGTRGAQKVS